MVQDANQTLVNLREVTMWTTIQALLDKRRDAEAVYGYIREREDLRKEPHGWKMPIAIKMDVKEVT